MAKITIADNKLNPEHADYSSTLAGLDFMAILRGATKKIVGENIEYDVTDSKVSIALALQLHGLGVEVQTQYFIEVVPTDVVPEGIPERASTDEGETVKTWEQWNEITTRDSRTFIELTDGQEYLKISELVPVFDSLIKPEDLPVEVSPE
jgi:hypothetical protein